MVGFAHESKYTITDEILNLTAHIAARVEVLTIQRGKRQDAELRRAAYIRNIYASLAIEGGVLSREQVAAIAGGESAGAPPEEIRKAQNTLQMYERLFAFDPYDEMDLRTAHRILMQDISEEAGRYRTDYIMIPDSGEMGHSTSPENEVSERMAGLLRRTKLSKAHPLIKTCLFLYEFEMVYPFDEGAREIGRMWYALLLYQWKEIFACLPLEMLLHERRKVYYAALGKAIQSQGDCTELIRFMLEVIKATLEMYTTSDPVSDQDSDQGSDPVSDQDNDQVNRLLDALGSRALSASALMEGLGLKHRPTFRKNYLHPALDAGLIEMTLPETPSARGQKYRKSKSNAILR